MPGRGRGRGKFTPPTGARLQLQKAAEECGFDARNLRSLQSRPELFPDILLHSSGLPMHAIQKRQEEQVQVKQEEEQKENATVKMEDSSQAVVMKKKSTIKTVRRSAKTSKLIRKGREMHHRMQNSPFFVRYTKDVPDVIRYSDTLKAEKSMENSEGGSMTMEDSSFTVVKSVMLNCLGGRTATKQGLFFPEELVFGPKRLNNTGWLTDNENANKKLNLEALEKQEKLKLRRIRMGLDDDDADKGENEFADDDLVEEDDEEQDDGGYGVNYYESEGDESAGDNGEGYI